MSFFFEVLFSQSADADYPGYQGFFSRAAGIFGVGRRPKPRVAKPREKLFARVTIKTRQKPETALEKSLAPRVDADRQINQYITVATYCPILGR